MRLLTSFAVLIAKEFQAAPSRNLGTELAQKIVKE
jgi:hypothetical protein